MKSKRKSIRLINLIIILTLILFVFFTIGNAFFSGNKTFSTIAAKIVNVDAEQNSYDEIKPNGLGDINDDGEITVEDALLIQEYLVELITFTEDQKLRADTNKDGNVDINDATYLQRYIELLNPYDKIEPNGLGDINDDGKITEKDVLLIQEYLVKSITFTEDQKLRADTNKDGSVNINDATYLQKYIITQNPYDEIEANGLGDINDDGKITGEDALLIQEYLAELITFTEDQKLRADTNKDGSVNINDVSFLQRYIMQQNLYDEIEANGLGDINDDGKITGEDALLIQEYLVELITFTEDQKLRADTNKDGNVDINDVTFLQRYIISQNPYDEIEPNGLGDINDDGIIDGDDATLIQEFLADMTTFTEDQKLRADTNKDGKVSIDDVTFLQRYIISQNPYDGIGPNELGDINDDGYVNGADVRLIQEFLAGITTLTEEQKLRADTNKDESVDINDVTFLQRYIESQNPYDEIKPNGLGDIDDDGSITSNDVKLIQEFLAEITTFTEDQKLRADMNKDGDIDISDATYLQKYIVEQNPYDEIKPNGLGDIDDDGSITSNDVKLIQEFLAEITTFTEDQKLRADTNKDGDIDISDATYLQKYIVEQNPYDEIKPNGLGDVNNDGDISVNDTKLIQEFLINITTFTEDQKLRADTNKDGSVNLRDVTLLQQYIGTDNGGPFITSITQSPTNWTNDNVTLIVYAIDYGGSEIEYSFDGGETWQSSNEYEVESNGTIEIKVKNSEGNTDSKSYDVINIDKITPVVSISNDSGDGTIIILADDGDGSGVASVKVNGDTLEQREGYTDQWIFTPEQNGTYTITVTDQAGNTTSIEKIVDYVDTNDEGPFITSITQSPTNWTNNNVTLIVHAVDYGGSEIEYSFDGGETWQSSNEYEVESNGTIEIKIKNSEGNTDSKSYDVMNIDKITPVVSISNDSSEGGIIILADDGDGSGVASVKVNGDTLEQREGYTGQWIFIPEQNGTYTIIVTDYAGNTTSIEKVIDDIDDNNNDNNNNDNNNNDNNNNDNNNDNNNNDSNNNNNNNNGSGSNSNSTNSKTANVSTSSSILPYAGGLWSKIIVALIVIFGVIGIRGYTLLKKYKNL